MNLKVGTTGSTGKHRNQTCIVLLHRAKEARLLPTQLKMVTEGKLRRYQGKKTKELQHRNFTLWDKRSEEEITVDQLLKKGGKIYGGQ